MKMTSKVTSIRAGVDPAEVQVIRNNIIYMDTEEGPAFIVGNPNSYQVRLISERRNFEVPSHFSKKDAQRVARTINSALENIESPTIADVNDATCTYIRHYVDYSIKD